MLDFDNERRAFALLTRERKKILDTYDHKRILVVILIMIYAPSVNGFSRNLFQNWRMRGAEM